MLGSDISHSVGRRFSFAHSTCHSYFGVPAHRGSQFCCDASEQLLTGPIIKAGRTPFLTVMQELCKQILKLTSDFTEEVRTKTNPEEDRSQITQMFIDVVAIAKRTRDAEQHCDDHMKDMVGCPASQRVFGWRLKASGWSHSLRRMHRVSR